MKVFSGIMLALMTIIMVNIVINYDGAEAQSEKRIGKKHVWGDAAIPLFANRGIKFSAPTGWKEPYAMLISPDFQEISIVNNGTEYSPSAEIIYIGPDHERDLAEIQMWLFDFNPKDFPIGIIAFSPHKWIAKGAELLTFIEVNEEYVTAPVSFGNVKAYKVRASFFNINVKDKKVEVIEDRYYCKDSRVFIMAAFRASKKSFDLYEKDICDKFLKSIRISK